MSALNKHRKRQRPSSVKTNNKNLHYTYCSVLRERNHVTTLRAKLLGWSDVKGRNEDTVFIGVSAGNIRTDRGNCLGLASLGNVV